jgi:phosphoglycerate dehydrogenase-like enzyme
VLRALNSRALHYKTARAPLVDEQALMDAVSSRRIFAALDVFYKEPLKADHPFTRAPNVVLTPHLGYSVGEVYREFYAQSIENALAFLDGKPIRVLELPK